MSVEAPTRPQTQKKSQASTGEGGSTGSSTSSSPAPPARSAYSYYDCNGYEMRLECKKSVDHVFYRCRYAGHCRGRASSEKGSSVMKQTVPHNHPPKHPPESMRPKQQKRGRPPKKPKQDRLPKKVTCEAAENKQEEVPAEDVPNAPVADSCSSPAGRSATNNSPSHFTRDLSEPTEEGDSTTTEDSNTTTIGMNLATLVEDFFGRTVRSDANKSAQSSPETEPAHEDHQEHPAEPTPAAMAEPGTRRENEDELRAKIFVLQNDLHKLRRASGVGSGKASFDSPSTSTATLNLQLQRQLDREERARKDAEQKYKQCVQDSKKIIEGRDQLQKERDRLVAEARRRGSAGGSTSCSDAECEKKLNDAEAKSRGWEGQFNDMRRKYETLKAAMAGATSENGSTQASSSKAVEKLPETPDVQSFKQKYEQERSLREKFQEVLANMTSQGAPTEQVDDADLKRQLELVNESAADYMTRCRKAEEELERLRDLNAPAIELSRRLESSGRQLAAALVAKQRLQTALDERNAEVSGLQERNAELEPKKRPYAAELARLSRKLKDANDKCAAYERDHNELKKAHAALEEKFAKTWKSVEPTLKKRAELLRRQVCLSCVERSKDKPLPTAECATTTSSSGSSQALNSSSTRSLRSEADVPSNEEDRPSTSSRAFVPLRHAPPMEPVDHESPRSPSPMPSSPPSLDAVFISSQAIDRQLPAPRSPSPERSASFNDHRSERDRNGEKTERKRPRSSLDDSPQSTDEDQRADDGDRHGGRKSHSRRKRSRPSKEPLAVITLSDEDDEAEPREEQREEEAVPEPDRSVDSPSSPVPVSRSAVKNLAERIKQLCPSTYEAIAQHRGSTS